MPDSPILLLFVQIALILALSRLIGWVFLRIGQPQVMGEMVAGILLGPSLLGLHFPGLYESLFPQNSHHYLQILSQLGVVLFLFLIGLELDPNLLRQRGRAAAAISGISILVPFLMGMLLTLYLYDRLFADLERPRFLASALFMGAAMSITAFPVLARILTERNLHKTPIGVLSIACAAINDVAAWCILAFVVAIAHEYTGPWNAIGTAAAAGFYLVVMFILVRPLLRRLEIVYERGRRLSQNMVALILLLVLASAFATETIGIHALFGAFVLGFIMPKGAHFVRHLSEKLEDFVIVLLLPLFFAYTGINTRLDLLTDPSLLGYAGLIILVACAGKIGGTTIAARLFGSSWRDASAIGILMNTRGLMELVILNIGRELEVISDTVFAMMVLMAIVTTAMTSPLLALVYPTRLFEAMARRRDSLAYSLLIPVSLPKTGGPLVQIAEMLIGPSSVPPKADAPPRIFAVHLREPSEHEAYRSGLDEPTEPSDALAPLLAQALNRNLVVEPIAIVSRDVPGDISNLAAAKNVDMVLMGFHKPVFGKTILGGTVHRVLATCPSHVGIFMDRGFRTAARILVPYLGGQHDRLALELASRMSSNTGAEVTILHVVPPLRGSGRSLDAKANVDRAFNDPAAKSPVNFKVVEDTSPVGVVLHQAQQFDLVIIGVSEEWGLESHLFGWRPERIAKDCPCSLLIVRRASAIQEATAKTGAASSPA